MFYFSDRLTLTSMVGLLFVSPLIGKPVFAHKVEVTADVAGTWHVEPNHAPKAGAPAQVWIALTRRGGELLPLAQSNCQLNVYAMPRSEGDQPVLKPTLEAITAEQYEGIPGAEVVFPKTGLYELELGCTPKTAGDFIPFQMNYQVTVATAVSPAALTESPLAELPEAEANPQASPGSELNRALLLLVPLGLGIVGLLLIKRKSKR
jgi:hypothetical protein